MTWHNFGTFHCLCGVINSATLTNGCGNVSTCSCSNSTRLQLSIQLSNQKEILCLLPSLHRMPSDNKCRLLSGLFQTCESEPFLVHWKKSQCARYLDRKHWTQRLDSYVISLQASLHWKATLTDSTRWSPRPPLLLGVHNVSHAIRGSPEEAGPDFHRKCRWILFNWEVIDWGKEKQCMVWAGSDSKWDWIKAVLPALLRSWAFHLSSQVLVFWISSLNVVWRGCPWKIGQPRYFPRDRLWGILNIPMVTLLWFTVAFLEKVRTDLLKFISWPETKQKWSRMCFILRVVCWADLQNKRQSSAKSRHRIFGLLDKF